MPLWVGCTDPKHYSVPDMPIDWAAQIVSLYKFRNKAAHEGRAVITEESGGVRPLAAGELQSFVFSLEVLYRWSNDQQLKFGVRSVSQSVDRSRQIVAILGEPLHGGGLVLDTSESSGVTTDDAMTSIET